jgi:hypothetical protein
MPRFTQFLVPIDKVEKEVSIHDLYSEIVVYESRNQLISEDVFSSYENRINCLVMLQFKIK